MAKILKFYTGSGSTEFWVNNHTPILSPEDWQKIRHTVIRLLTKRGEKAAAEVLEQNSGLGIYKGVNAWNDDFNVLYGQVGIDDYVRYGELIQTSPDYSVAWRLIVRTLGELGHSVRFVGVEFVPDDSPQLVVTPTPKLTSSAVEQALSDAEQLVVQLRPVSAVDRAHTALHGYLRQVCAQANLVVQNQDSTLTELVKILIKQHPKFVNAGAHKVHIEKILKAMSVTCDALNPIRNHGSLAHANEALLEPAEAILAINASRTVFHYIQQKAGA